MPGTRFNNISVNALTHISVSIQSQHECTQIKHTHAVYRLTNTLQTYVYIIFNIQFI